MTTSDTTHGLRYLDAESVRCFTTNLSGFKVCTGDAQPLGSVNGVLISPSSRQLRYFVIETAGLFARRYLLPADAGAVFDEVRKTLQIGAKKDELDLQSFKLEIGPAILGLGSPRHDVLDRVGVRTDLPTNARDRTPTPHRTFVPALSSFQARRSPALPKTAAV